MSHPRADEIRANLERADETLEAARLLLREGFYDSAASRAYYAAFYAVTAALLHEGEAFRSHSGVVGAFHRVFVRTGRLDATHGKALNRLFELRAIGDYGERLHVPAREAAQAVADAATLIEHVRRLLGAATGDEQHDDR